MRYRVFLYPGQGSQALGMGVSVRDAYPEAAAVFEQASELAGYDMAELCSSGPLEKLSRTLYTQPALFTVEAAITDVLRAKGVKPDAVAGHSLGEFSAWYTAGVYGFGDGFRLVSERGRLMDGADPEGRGTMAAVIGLDPDVVRDVCSSIEGQVVVANYNSPQQQVISGEKTAVEKACAALSEKGAKRVLPIKVSGAFHSPLMETARERFAMAIDGIFLSDARIPVFANILASPVIRAGDIRSCMVRQLTGSVRWIETIEAIMKEGQRQGADMELYEVGPGYVLSGLVKRIAEGVAVRSISDISGIEEVA